ncbi:MAG: four helix bundle protein [Bacteroidetes bacterium]|nr:four helix bundle protein [Bacteroidota bacterium]MBK8486663.1 four helix bundle protein [Bacteroidota bacterium]MBK8683446.1 four helix bundle protein [Bacteroidota bacterium]
MSDFRFENLEIWKESILISNILFDKAEIAEKIKYYRFAEQLRGAALSISNNIAEGSGSFSKKDFALFLNFARRSIFECANILFIFELRNIITKEERAILYSRLLILSKQITNFRKSLLT